MKTVSLAGDDERLVAIFRALGNPLRMQLVRYMAEHPLCITGDLVQFSSLAQSTVSEHLKVLREAGLIEGTKRGRWIDYELTPGALDRLRDALPGAALPERPLVVVR